MLTLDDDDDVVISPSANDDDGSVDATAGAVSGDATGSAVADVAVDTSSAAEESRCNIRPSLLSSGRDDNDNDKVNDRGVDNCRSDSSVRGLSLGT